jgi:hypothetical protein
MPAERSQEYRRLAAEWMDLVRQASDPQARASLPIMSQRWLEQAERAERHASTLSHASTMSSRGCVIQNAIAEQLRALYQPSRCLPPHILALLAQLDHPENG